MMPPSLVVIGASMGGLEALEVILGGLPKDFPLPVVIVQHRGKDADDSLRALLQHRCALTVCEPEDKEELVSGRVYIAPADYHLLVEKGSLALSTEAPVNHARPSVDVLFDSAADAYGSQVVGVILTGRGQDGARGALRVKQRGGFVIVQDPATAEARAMPDCAMAATKVDNILPLPEIAAFLASLCQPH